jgi:hypothetical protein
MKKNKAKKAKVKGVSMPAVNRKKVKPTGGGRTRKSKPKVKNSRNSAVIRKQMPGPKRKPRRPKAQEYPSHLIACNVVFRFQQSLDPNAVETILGYLQTATRSEVPTQILNQHLRIDRVTVEHKFIAVEAELVFLDVTFDNDRSSDPYSDSGLIQEIHHALLDWVCGCQAESKSAPPLKIESVAVTSVDRNPDPKRFKALLQQYRKLKEKNITAWDLLMAHHQVRSQSGSGHNKA